MPIARWANKYSAVCGRPATLPSICSTGLPKCKPRSTSPATPLDRLHRLAYSGPLPPALAAGFTVAELAVLRIITDEVRDRGTPDRAAPLFSEPRSSGAGGPLPPSGAPARWRFFPRACGLRPPPRSGGRDQSACTPACLRRSAILLRA